MAGWARSLIYFPTRTVPPVDAVLAGGAEVMVETEDGLALAAWHLPVGGGAPLVIVFHGNGGNRADRAGLARGLADRGLSVLLTDYRGYGGNPGRPSETGLAADARAAAAWAHRTGAGPVVYFGESLGAAVAVGLAGESPPATLVLRSPFTSLAEVGRFHHPFLPVRLMLGGGYPSLDRIRGVAAPLMIVAGTADRIVPFEQSRRLYEAAPGPKRLLEIAGAGHNDELLAEGAAMLDAVAAFVGEHAGHA